METSFTTNLLQYNFPHTSKKVLDELVLEGQWEWVRLNKRDEEQSEWGGRKGGGLGILPACTSFIFLIKAGAVGAVKNEPKDMGIGDRAWASCGGEKGREQPEQADRPAMSNYHLKLNPPPSGMQIKTSYLCSPSLPA